MNEQRPLPAAEVLAALQNFKNTLPGNPRDLANRIGGRAFNPTECIELFEKFADRINHNENYAVNAVAVRNTDGTLTVTVTPTEAA